MDTIELTWDFGFGLDEKDDDPDNVLSRAHRVPLREGRPVQRMALCFFCATEDPDSEDDPRWFGVFTYTEGGYVVFTPGFAAARQLVAYQGKREREESFPLDHVTLEDNCERFHFSGPRRRDRLGSMRTQPIGDSGRLWFGLSLRDKNVLHPVSKETVVSASVSATDTRRRIEILRLAREGQVDLVASLASGAKTRFERWFLHFAVLVGRPDAPTYAGPELAYPHASPFLANPLPERMEQLPIRTHQLRLGERVGLQILTTCLPGSTTVPVAFTSPGKPERR